MSQSQSPPQPDLAKLVSWAKTEDSTLIDYFKDTVKDFCKELSDGMNGGTYQRHLHRVPYPHGIEFPHTTSNEHVNLLKVKATIAPKDVKDEDLDLTLSYAMAPDVMEIQQKLLNLKLGAFETVDGRGALLQVRHKEPFEVWWMTRVGLQFGFFNVTFATDLDEACLRAFHQAVGSPAL